MISSVIRIFEIIIVCLMVVNLEGKSLQPLQTTNNEEPNNRIKRGYGHYSGNDFSSSIQLISPVLQYDESGHHHSSSSLDANSHLSNAAAIASADPWSASGLSPGYEVWLEPSSNIHASSAFDTSNVQASSHISDDDIGSLGDLHASSLGSSHPANEYITSSTFSHAQPSSQLHTQISSSSISSSYGSDLNGVGDINGHGISAISDNIDFNNVDDVKGKHYTKSYGK